MKAEGFISTWFKIITGVRQGDIWSPLMFGSAIDFVMKQAVDRSNRGITLMPRRSLQYTEVRFSDLDYADDIDLFEESDTRMTETLDDIRTTAGKPWPPMSFTKTELMSIGKPTSSNPIFPLGNEGNIKVVEHFMYLGAFSSTDGTNVKELNNRIGKAAGTFRRVGGSERLTSQPRHQDEDLQLLRPLNALVCCWVRESDWKRWGQAGRVWYDMPKKDPANCVVTAYHKWLCAFPD